MFCRPWPAVANRHPAALALKSRKHEALPRPRTRASSHRCQRTTVSVRYVLTSVRHAVLAVRRTDPRIRFSPQVASVMRQRTGRPETPGAFAPWANPAAAARSQRSCRRIPETCQSPPRASAPAQYSLAHTTAAVPSARSTAYTCAHAGCSPPPRAQRPPGCLLQRWRTESCCCRCHCGQACAGRSRRQRDAALSVRSAGCRRRRAAGSRQRERTKARRCLPQHCNMPQMHLHASMMPITAP